jgi:uncharacterized protein YggU (UPF0235/DUF167 family)
MKIFVKAKPNSKENKIEEIKTQDNLFDNKKEKFDFSFVVKVKEKPVLGRANEAIITILAEHFGIARFSINLISGVTSKNKIFKIEKN